MSDICAMNDKLWTGRRRRQEELNLRKKLWAIVMRPRGALSFALLQWSWESLVLEHRPSPNAGALRKIITSEVAFYMPKQVLKRNSVVNS